MTKVCSHDPECLCGEAPEVLTPFPPEDPYRALTRQLAEALCPGGVEQGACHSCEDAAYRIVAKRRVVRELLIAFARSEAGLMPDPTAITSRDLRTMVMQEDDDA